jgi:hypothetical protein
MFFEASRTRRADFDPDWWARAGRLQLPNERQFIIGLCLDGSSLNTWASGRIRHQCHKELVLSIVDWPASKKTGEAAAAVP